MAINYIALRTEIELVAYAANRGLGADNAIADQLNAIVLNNKVNTGLIPNYLFGGLIVASEYNTLTVTMQNYIQMLMVAPSIDINNLNIRNGLGAIFGAATTTRANVLAAQQRDGSRAETLFGIGTVVSSDDVAKARVLLAPGTPGW